jgi:hypothetical protein
MIDLGEDTYDGDPCHARSVGQLAVGVEQGGERVRGTVIAGVEGGMLLLGTRLAGRQLVSFGEQGCLFLRREWGGLCLCGHAVSVSVPNSNDASFADGQQRSTAVHSARCN